VNDAEFRRRAHALLQHAVIMEEGASHARSEEHRAIIEAGPESSEPVALVVGMLPYQCPRCGVGAIMDMATYKCAKCGSPLGRRVSPP